MNKEKLKYLSHLGFSIIPCSETKAPIGAWKKYQTEKRNPDEIDLLNSPLYAQSCLPPLSWMFDPEKRINRPITAIQADEKGDSPTQSPPRSKPTTANNNTPSTKTRLTSPASASARGGTPQENPSGTS